MKKIFIIAITIVVLLFTACWDKVELDRRTFILGTAIDASTNSDKYIMTIETPLTKIINSTVGAGGEDQMKTTLTESKEGISAFDIVRKLDTQTDKVLYWGHQQVLIIGEEAAKKNNIMNIIDFWKRDPEIIRSTYVFISQGQGQDIFKVIPKHSTSISLQISNQVAEQVKKTSELIKINLIQFISRLINNKGDILVGRIKVSADNDVELSGSGVLKDGILRGWLNNNETTIANIIMEKVEGGNFSIPDNENIISLDILEEKTDIASRFKNNQPVFTIDIKLVCSIGDMTQEKKLDEKLIKAIELNGEMLIKNKAQKLIKKIQKEYKADVFEFGNYLYKHHNKKWKEIEKEWDKIYPNVTVNVNVELLINHQGLFYEE